MEAWGCEYVDDGSFGVALARPSMSQYLQIPMDLLHRIVDKRYIQEITVRDAKRLIGLKNSIQTNGLQHPGKLVYDRATLRLQDGNHRYICASQLQWEYFPVELVRVDNIRAPGMAIESIFHELMIAKFGG